MDNSRLPNLVIPGAPKCGTSALAEYLASRDDVYLSHIKEPNFWSSDMPGYALREGLTSPADYERLFREAKPWHRYRLDASTHYLYSARAIEAISQHVPDVRLIVCVRPQAEIAAAWHMQMVNAGYDDVTDFMTAWRLCETRRQGHALPARCLEPALLDYEAVASVGRQLQRALVHIDKKRIYVMFLEDLKRDPRGTYLEILDFLELADDGRSEFEKTNAAHRNRSASLSRLARNRHLRPWVNRSMAVLGTGTSTRLKTAVKRVLYAPAERQAPDDTQIALLRAAFRDDNDILEAITGRRVSR